MQNQIYRKYPFWSLAGPLLGFLAIQMAVQFVIEAPYLLEAYKELMRVSAEGTLASAQEIVDVYVRVTAPALEWITAHQVEISAASSGAAMILTGTPVCGRPETGKEIRGGTAEEGGAGQVLDAGCIWCRRITGSHLPDGDGSGGFLRQPLSADFSRSLRVTFSGTADLSGTSDPGV